VDEFKVNKTYDFMTLAPSVLGASYVSMKVRSIMTAQDAMRYQEVYTTHNNLLSVITGLPVNIDDCTFILFENSDGEKTVLALEYIDQDSITLVVSRNIRVDIMSAKTEDIALIRTILVEHGYNDINISTF